MRYFALILRHLSPTEPIKAPTYAPPPICNPRMPFCRKLVCGLYWQNAAHHFLMERNAVRAAEFFVLLHRYYHNFKKFDEAEPLLREALAGFRARGSGTGRLR